MKTNMNDIDELIIDYLTFNLTDEGAEILREWLSRSDANRIYFRKTQGIWYGVHTFGNEPFNKQIAYKRFISHIDEDKKEEIKEKRGGRNFYLSKKKWGMIAAVAVLIIGIFGGMRLLYKTQDVCYTISVPLGSKSHITLPDKSLVWLNAGTSFEYRYDHQKKERRVKIDGEAYFEVAKNRNVPFIVETGCIDVQVLGTKFNVDSYSSDRQVNVALLEGSISLRRKDKDALPILVAPNETAVYDKQKKEILITQANSSQSISWTDGILEFEDETFERVAQKLSRKYNVVIHIADTLLYNKRFYGTFDERESIYEILNKITSGGTIAYEMKDKTIVIYSQK